MEKRKIKFRSYDKRFKRMDFGAGDLLLRINDNDFSESMQFTGLLDKNGKEIYESDIVRDVESNINFIVRYEPTQYYIENIEDGDWGNSLSYRGETWEVIGNVFENPELVSKLK